MPFLHFVPLPTPASPHGQLMVRYFVGITGRCDDDGGWAQPRVLKPAALVKCHVFVLRNASTERMMRWPCINWHARQPNKILQPFLWTLLLLEFDLVSVHNLVPASCFCWHCSQPPALETKTWAELGSEPACIEGSCNNAINTFGNVQHVAGIQHGPPSKLQRGQRHARQCGRSGLWVELGSAPIHLVIWAELDSAPTHGVGGLTGMADLGAHSRDGRSLGLGTHHGAGHFFHCVGGAGLRHARQTCAPLLPLCKGKSEHHCKQPPKQISGVCLKPV